MKACRDCTLAFGPGARQERGFFDLLNASASQSVRGSSQQVVALHEVPADNPSGLRPSFRVTDAHKRFLLGEVVEARLLAVCCSPPPPGE